MSCSFRFHSSALPAAAARLRLSRGLWPPSSRRLTFSPTLSISPPSRPAAIAAASPLGASQEASAMAVSDSESVGQYDLLIVGPGVLGRIVAERWQQEHPDCKIFGHTATTDHHSELTQLGIIPSLKGPAVQKVPYVIFCAPPYRTDDYPGDLRQEIIDLVNRSGKFDTKFQGFTGTDGPLGKRMDNSKTRAEIGWQPKYPSFTEFLGLSN
uniref:Uncharacterized protein n=1 Tax=Oryza meridionalis TaxID=40149 RepID=A0A0E0C1Z3_9ORYZ